jgi:3-isopropylmalate dehydrogenase
VKLLLLDGDGIGPEIAEVAARVLDAAAKAAGATIEVQRMPVGERALALRGTTLPEDVWAAAQAADGIVLGPLSTAGYPPREQGGINASAEFRSRLDLYANIRPARRPASAGSPAIDLVIARENSEGFYAVRTLHRGYGEFMPDPDTCLALRKISAGASRRIAEVAFRLADSRSRRLTIVHKANVLKMSDGLFIDCVRQIGAAWPRVEIGEMFVDAAAAALVRNPESFDVIVTTNLFGDILSNLAAEVAGGLGGGGSLNAGNRLAMAQAAHGSAPDIAGRDEANPIGLLRSVAMLLNWAAGHLARDDLARAGAAIEAAVETCLARPGCRTRDMGGAVGTRAFGEGVVAALDSGAQNRAGRAAS